MDYIHRLRDPHLVASFQRFCGVHPVKDRDYDAAGNSRQHREASRKAAGKSPDTASGQPCIGGKVNASTPNEKSNAKNTGSSSQALKNGGSMQDLEDEDYHENSARGTNGCSRQPASFEVRNRTLYYLFHLGAGLGNEIFYCMFFPYWFWNVDGYVCRRLILVWCWVMYFGQATKDVIRWPRPKSPPAMRLEERYALEYGMPSTHAMIGLAFPLFLVLLTMNRYEYRLDMGAAAAVLWCLCVCLSRLYLGMHSVADVVVGLLLDAILLPLIYLMLDTIDEFQLTHPYAPLVMFCVTLAMALFYPTLDTWSTARGDTTICIGVTFGVAVASWINYQNNFMPHNHELVGEPPYHIKTPDLQWFGEAIVRMLIGYSLLFLTRAVAKTTTYNVACYLLNLNRLDTMSNKQQLIVELPYKYITYTAIAINVVYTSPAIFRMLGIERPTAWTEV